MDAAMMQGVGLGTSVHRQGEVGRALGAAAVHVLGRKLVGMTFLGAPSGLGRELFGVSRPTRVGRCSKHASTARGDGSDSSQLSRGRQRRKQPRQPRASSAADTGAACQEAAWEATGQLPSWQWGQKVLQSSAAGCRWCLLEANEGRC